MTVPGRGADGDPRLAEATEDQVPDRERLEFTPVFVVGCPRSGTTWIQLLLAEHPDVVTAPETQIFAYYLDHFRRQWRQEQEGAEGDGQGQGTAGLSRLLSEQEFDRVCRNIASAVLRRIAAGDQDAGIVVEKSPRHALHVQWIHRLFPEARFLHVIRDPRDTVSSLIAAGRSWGSGWAPRGPVEGGRAWRENVDAARWGRAIPGNLYYEIRYEELSSDAADAIREVYAWLGLPADRDLAERAAEACRLDRLRKEADGEEMPLPGEESPEGFFRKGKAGGWEEDLSSGQVRVIEYLCRDLMEELGYRQTRPVRMRTRARVAFHDVLQRVRESIDWQLERVIRRV